MAMLSLLSMVLRVAELVFACIVAGVNGAYLHAVENTSSWDQARFIFAEVVAGLSILLAIIWLFPFSGSFVHWPVDLVISICWFVAFGLIVRLLDGACGSAFDWEGIKFRGVSQCGNWKAIIAFSFLSAICWLVSAIIGFMWVRDHDRTYRRRTYGRTSRV
ncbi:marvel domain-containing protein [Pseudomassariella vexata]|uniref:Marvel domain-containing protein n=1 Tax=Pseudomassariella vexata TaxID=1141098 RepID=A0A1Y2EB48_9PEZI|nr:marvel domain-containing protein [Pseudomassariella vexata]ORY68790.1 marvel domain-containing protein [Pseudomassariella vexata]